MKALLIAEKPSLMREVKSVYDKHKGEFPDQIDFMAQAGHLVGLKTPKEVDEEKYGKWDLRSLPEVYPYEYKILEGKHKLVQDIKKAVKSGEYDYIINAGDADQEGELLIRLVLAYIGSRLPVRRFWNNDLTENGILESLHNLKDDAEMDTIYASALVRQHADFQVGMNVTSAATLKMGELCKLGRIKAAIVAMLVERERAIRDFVEKRTYRPAFSYKDCEFIHDKPFDEEKDALAFNPETNRAYVTDVKVNRNKKKAPKLFKLSTLQTESYKVLKMAAEDTLATLQSLYEKKAVTYPRSGCEYISPEVDIGGIAKKVLREVPVDVKLLTKDPEDVLKDKTYANAKEIQKEGHTAIIPTGNGLPSSCSDKEKALYELICRRFLAIFAREKETESLKVSAVPEGMDKDAVYLFSESYDIDPGFEFVLNPAYKRKEGCGFSFKKEMELIPISFFAKESVTKPPARYNNGSLIEAMEKPEVLEDGEEKIKFKLGTPATRAGIIKECEENGYYTVKSGAYYATPKAEAVIDAFPGVALFDPVETGRWEKVLEQIRSGEMDSEEAETAFLKEMKDTVESMKAADVAKLSAGAGGSSVLGKCPKCGADIVSGKFGPYCSGKCGMSVGKYMGKNLTPSQIKTLLKGDKVLIKGLTSKEGKKYDIFIRPVSVEPYSYTKKDGSTASGFQWNFEREFPPRKK